MEMLVVDGCGNYSLLEEIDLERVVRHDIIPQLIKVFIAVGLSQTGFGTWKFLGLPQNSLV